MQTLELSELDVEIIETDLNDSENSDLPTREETGEADYDFENEDQKSFDEKESTRFKEGEKLTMIRVRFPGNARSFAFLVGKRKFAYGQKVVAMSDRGMTVGYINSFPYEVTFNKQMLPIRSIAKAATAEDIQAQIEFRDSEKKAEVICLRLIEKYQLDMVLTHVEFTQFGKKAVFYFNAPARVDFRDLVKDLVYELKMRIELRQISVRDRAAALGSVGACGLQTCCSSFLKNYGNVSIKMAKNQNLALIPTKLNGVCGQIKCCIRYEDDVYTDKRKNLPREGSFVSTLNGDRGKVLKLNILVEQFEMLTDQGIKRRYSSNQYKGRDADLGSDYRFPENFDNIINETQTVIGLTAEEQVRADKFLEHNALATAEKVLNEEDADFFRKNQDFEDIENEEGQTDSKDDSKVESKAENSQNKTEVKGEAAQAPSQNNRRPDHRDRQNQNNQRRDQRPQHNNNQNRRNDGPRNQGQGQGQGQQQNRDRSQNRPQGQNQNNQNQNQNQNQNRNNNRNNNRPRPGHNQGNNRGGQGGNQTPPPAAE